MLVGRLPIRKSGKYRTPRPVSTSETWISDKSRNPVVNRVEKRVEITIVGITVGGYSFIRLCRWDGFTDHTIAG